MGNGIRLFGHLDTEPIELALIKVVEGVDVTHLRYRI
jgi:hypothetical protein